MSDGFEEAKSQRNWLERLGEKIPGFSGFQDRELRREVDKMQREHLANEITRLKVMVRTKAQGFTDQGEIGSLHLFDRLDRRLDGLSQTIRFSDYGATGFFDVVKVDEADLERLYEFDVSLLEDLGDLRGDLAAVPVAGEGDPEPAIQEALSRLQMLGEKWAGRRNIVSKVVQT
jgi:hypothetical protein